MEKRFAKRPSNPTQSETYTIRDDLDEYPVPFQAVAIVVEQTRRQKRLELGIDVVTRIERVEHGYKITFSYRAPLQSVPRRARSALSSSIHKG